MRRGVQPVAWFAFLLFLSAPSMVWGQNFYVALDPVGFWPGGPGQVQGEGNIFVTGSRAYLAAGTRGLEILDVSEPQQPLLIGRLYTSGTVEGVHVSGDFAYVAEGTSGFSVV